MKKSEVKIKLTKRGEGCAKINKEQKLPDNCPQGYTTYFRNFVWKNNETDSAENIREVARGAVAPT